MSYAKQHELGLAGLALLRNRLVGDEKTTREVLDEIHRLTETPKNALLSISKVKEYSVSAGYKAWAATYDNIPNLLAEAVENYAVAVNSVEFRQPTTAIILDTTGNVASSVDAIKQAVLNQLVSRVLWVDAVKKMSEKGANTFVEVGAGSILSGLIKRISPSARTLNVEDEASLERTLSVLTA